jgi:proline iminopeptidase
MNTESHGGTGQSLRELYAPRQPFNSGMLPVSELHQIYFEESGNPKGKPVVFVHGGPGGGTDPSQRGFFNPDVYRIVLFDQRGCGKSLPYASLVDNTTWDLVEDMEKLRKHLGIARWQVFGGSWGSTLALAYAETHPECVTELVLRGIFLVRKQEIDWFYQRGASAIYPDAWEHYLKAIPEAEHGDLVLAYHKRLTSDDPAVRLAAARAWSIWEGSTSRLYTDPKFISRYAADDFAVAFARIECHYFVNKGFLREGQLLEDVHKIRHIPTVIVQGRYDVVCPIESAWALHRAFPEAELVIVNDAGHSAKEPGNASALIEATDRFGANFVPEVETVAAGPAQIGTAGDTAQRCVFLDRDGVINVGINVTEASDFQLIPGAREAIVKLKQAGFKVVVATNQGGLGENLDGSIRWKAHPLSRKALGEIHARMLELLGEEAKPDAIKVCPHSKSVDCSCRKPAPGMLLAAAAELSIDLKRSFMVGDRDTDVATGIAAGATGILVMSGPDGDTAKDKNRVPSGTPIFASLKEAAAWILLQN